MFEFFVGGIAVAGEHAAEHAFYVAVEYAFALPEGKSGNGGGGAAAHAAEFFQILPLLRKHAAEFVHHLLRGLVQIARAAVIAQARP